MSLPTNTLNGARYTRRQFAQLAFLASLTPVLLCNKAESDDYIFLSACASINPAEENYAIAAFSSSDDIHSQKLLFKIPVAQRGHGFAKHPIQHDIAVAFSRRPGNEFQVINCSSGKLLSRHLCASGRHLYGHGVFSKLGDLLFTSENDYAQGTGVIGIRETDSYRSLGEFPTYGTGPHEIALMPDGRTLAVCNGGIQTHPNTPRKKLNLFDMQASLAYIDSFTGELISSHRIDNKYLSIRHLSVFPDGKVALSMQFEGPQATGVPLVGVHYGNNGPINLISAPEPVLHSMKNYAGAIRANPVTGIAAVACPKGNLITFWDITNEKYSGSLALPDAGGIGLTADRNQFVIASGTGHVFTADTGLPGSVTNLPDSYDNIRWDNHLQELIESI